MTCKDCLYYEHCHSHIAYGMGSDDLTGKYYTDIETRCKSFKNKSDYAEVKHCKLNFSGYSLTGDRTYKCTECNFLVANIDDVQMNFCPGCGAKIDGINMSWED